MAIDAEPVAGADRKELPPLGVADVKPIALIDVAGTMSVIAFGNNNPDHRTTAQKGLFHCGPSQFGKKTGGDHPPLAGESKESSK